MSVDIGAVFSAAWAIVRGSRQLWWLGAISAAQGAIYSAVVMLMVLPSLALPQLVIPLQAASSVTSPQAAGPSALSRAFMTGSEAVVRYLPTVIAGIVALLLIWVVSGIFDVAAQVGTITQVAEERRGRRASVASGLRGGFGVWWQTVGLLAIAALPALALVLGLGISTLFTYTLPLMRGQLPSTAATVSGQLLLAPLQGVVSIVSIALGVIVQLGLRFVALEGAAWRRALGEAWSMVRAHSAEVALTYVFLAVAGIPVAVVSALAVAVVAVFVGGLAAASAALAGASTLGAGVIAIAAVAAVATPVVLAIQAVFLAWYSAVWTVLWQGVRGGKRQGTGTIPLADEGVHSIAGAVAPGRI
jgi:hypothetical protein